LPRQIEDALSRTKVPGLAVAVVSHDTVLYESGFGVRDVSTGVRVDPDTVFEIASLSKPISATILAKAMTIDPELTWSTPVRTLMPDMALADPYVTQNITIGDFFAHRSGIPTSGGDDLEDLGFDRDYILAHLREIPLQLLLNDGMRDGSAFIDSTPLNQALSAQIVSSAPGDLDQRPSHYGFGMNVGSGAGGRVTLSHSGAFALGAATALTLVPDLDLGIVVLTNGAPVGLPEAVAQTFFDQVMYGHATRDWVETMGGYFANFNAPSCDLVGTQPPADAAASGPASDYAGTYVSPYFGTLSVTEVGGRLRGALGPTGATTFDITPWNGDTMAYAPAGENALPGSLSSVVFARSQGAVSSVTLSYLNQYPHVAQPSGLGVFTRSG